MLSPKLPGAGASLSGELTPAELQLLSAVFHFDELVVRQIMVSRRSVVVFEREVARSMICHSLVNFSIKEDELRSAPIHAGEFASFCQLKPGRYRYKIVRPDANLAAGTDARRMLQGEILIGNE